MGVTPVAGLTDTVVTGGTAVVAIGPNPNGGYITNPATATTPLYVDPVGAAQTVAKGTTFALAPGQTWTVIPGQTSSTSVNASDDAHDFSVVVW